MSELKSIETKTRTDIGSAQNAVEILAGGALACLGIVLSLPVLGPEATAFSAVVLGLILISPARREQVLGAASFGTFYFLWIRNVPGPAAKDPILMAGTLATWSTILAIVIRFRQRITPLGLLTAFLAALALLGWNAAPTNPIAREVYFALSRFGFLIWYLGLALASWKEKPFTLKDIPFILVPFWSVKVHTLPMPGLGPLMDREPLTRKLLLDRQLAGIRIILLGWMALAIRDTINWSLFSAGNAMPFIKALPTASLIPFGAGFGDAYASHVTLWLKWVCVIAHFVQAYMEMAYYCAFPVGMARLAGLDLPPMFDSPWKAKTMAQFYGRMLFYYNRMLIGLFYRPLKSRLQFIRSRQLQVYFALVGSLFLGGFLIHFVRDFRKISDQGLLAGVNYYANTIPYFLIITMLVGASVFSRRKKFARDSFTLQVARTSVYLVGWALVYTAFVATAHSETTWADYLTYMRSLIGL